MNLRTLQSLIVLADELNFSRAAERLHIAQPALSQQIRALEHQLEVQLIDRGVRPIRMTEAGAYLVAEARQILAASDEAARGAWEIGLGHRGWLAVGFTRSSMYSVLPIALKMFHTERPNVELKLYEMVTEEQTDALHEGRIHVGIGRQPAVVAGCTTQVLLRERVMAVLPPEHPSAGDESVRIADLVASPLILYPKQPTAQFAVFIESFFRAEGFVPRVEHRTFEIQTAIALVSAGLGITFVGESVAALGRGDVVYRYLAGSDAARVTTLEATYGTNDSSPHLRAFLGCLPDLGITGVADAAV